MRAFDQLDINTFGGNDNVDLDLAVVGLAKFVNVGAGNDTVNLLGVAVDPADPTVYGGDGDDVIFGTAPMRIPSSAARVTIFSSVPAVSIRSMVKKVTISSATKSDRERCGG